MLNLTSVTRQNEERATAYGLNLDRCAKCIRDNQALIVELGASVDEHDIRRRAQATRDRNAAAVRAREEMNALAHDGFTIHVAPPKAPTITLDEVITAVDDRWNADSNRNNEAIKGAALAFLNAMRDPQDAEAILANLPTNAILD